MAINIEENDPQNVYISQTKVGDTTYTLKDAATRTALSAVEGRVTVNEENIADNAEAIEALQEEVKGGVHYRGKVKELLSDGSTLSVVTIIDSETETSLTASAGDLVHSKKNAEATSYDLEFIFSGKTWSELGSTSGLGDLAYKDEVTATYTPTGSVNVTAIADASYDLNNGTLTGTAATLTSEFTGTTATLQTTFSGNEITATAAFTGTAVTPTGSFTGTEVTPTGSFTGTEKTLSAEFTGTAVTPTGSFTGTEFTSTGTFTPAGTVSKPNVTVTTGSAATGSATVNNEILTISFGTALTATTAELAEAPTFSGTEGNVTAKGTATGNINIDAITPTGNIAVEKFTPAGSVTVDAFTPSGSIAINAITPAGSVAVDSFTPAGTIADISYTPAGSIKEISYTPAGSVTGSITIAGHTHAAGFSGSEATITSK